MPGVVPDLATFGKGMANGLPLAAVVGPRELMREFEDVFVSSTFGGDTLALAACLATLDVYRREPVIEHLHRQGDALRRGVEQAVERHGLQSFVKIVGRPSCLAYATLDEQGEPSQAFRTLFLQETIRRGILMPSLVVSYTHSDDDVARTVEAVDGAFAIYAQALDRGVEHYLAGRPSQVVMRRFNQDGAIGTSSPKAAAS